LNYVTRIIHLHLQHVYQYKDHILHNITYHNCQGLKQLSHNEVNQTVSHINGYTNMVGHYSLVDVYTRITCVIKECTEWT